MTAFLQLCHLAKDEDLLLTIKRVPVVPDPWRIELLVAGQGLKVTTLSASGEKLDDVAESVARQFEERYS